MPFAMHAVTIANRERLHALQARAKAQGMTEAEFAALVRAVNDRAMVSSTWGSPPERLDEIEAGLKRHAADPFGSRPCPYCGEPCECDTVDVGVGLVQCGPYHCDACLASECGPYDSENDQARRNPKTGWYPPASPPGSSANVLDGKIVSASDMKSAYRDRFAGSPDYEEPGKVEDWFNSHRFMK